MSDQDPELRIGPAEKTAAQSLVELLFDLLQEPGRGIRAEDAISAAASIVAERCIEAAGDYEPRNHSFSPGQRVFSTRVNELLSGDQETVAAAPPGSIVGLLRDQTVGRGYEQDEFPELPGLLGRFAASQIEGPADWGRAPLSVPEENRPYLLPLRVEYETRADVDRLFRHLDGPPARLTAAILALAEILVAVERVIDHRVALLLALETVNGMAKTAPMTDQAWAQVSGEVAGKAAGKAESALSKAEPKRPWWRFW